MSSFENPVSIVETCELCGEAAAVQSLETQQFAYLDGQEEVLLTAVLPVVACAACGEAYLGTDAEMIQHEAVCHYLGRLTPSEIRALRDRHGLTQAKLAERTGIGIASIKRWENGTVIQNASLDARLRQVDELAAAETKPRPAARFRTQFTAEMIEGARTFSLRPQLLPA